MDTVATEFSASDATQLSKVALELDPTVLEYSESEIGGVDWLAVVEQPPDGGPLCTNCGAQFGSRSRCPECGAQRVRANTVTSPDRFTVAVAETDTGSRLEIALHGLDESDSRAAIKHLSFGETLRRLLEEHESVEAAEQQLFEAEGGYLKESETVRSPNQRRERTESEAETNDVLLEIIKIEWVLGFVLFVLFLFFLVFASL